MRNGEKIEVRNTERLNKVSVFELVQLFLPGILIASDILQSGYWKDISPRRHGDNDCYINTTSIILVLKNQVGTMTITGQTIKITVLFHLSNHLWAS